MRFNIGEKVIATRTIVADHQKQGIEKGKIYPVLSMIFCPRCGVQAINVTNQEAEGHKREVKCNCDTIFPMLDRYKYSASEYFTRLENKEELLEKAIAEEDYEFATQIRDL